MFQIFNISGLLRYEFESKKEPAYRWNIKRFSLAPDSDDHLKWEVILHSEAGEHVAGWAEFLNDYKVAGTRGPSVRAFIEERLEELIGAIKGVQKKQSWLKSIMSKRNLSHDLVELFHDPESAVSQWTVGTVANEVSGMGSKFEEVIQSLLPGIEADRRFVVLSAREEEKKKHTRQELDGSDSPSRSVHHYLMEERMTRSLEQALGNCKGLFSLDDPCNTPENVESVLYTALGGALTTVLLEGSREFLSDKAVNVEVILGDVGKGSRDKTDNYHYAWVADLPLWSRESPVSVPVDVFLNVNPPSKTDKSLLSELVTAARHIFNDWLKHRTIPLAEGGEAWTMMLPHGVWNAERFKLWYDQVEPREKLNRLAMIKEPPTDPQKKQAWDTWLRSMEQHAATFRADDWQVVLSVPDHWTGGLGDKMIGLLRSRSVEVLGSPDTSAFEMEAWLDVWRKSYGEAGPFTTDVDTVIRQLAGRCKETASPVDAELMLQLWDQTGGKAEHIPPLAEACALTGVTGPEELKQVLKSLPETDDRKTAASMFMGGESANGDVLPWHILALDSGDHKSWRVDPEVVAKVVQRVDTQIQELDRSQDHEAWESVVSHRSALIEMGLYKE